MQVGTIKAGQTVLFQGDSITDAGRDRQDPQNMGSGYANFISAWITATYPSLQVQFFNRGISGNRVGDLLDRWHEDCIDLRPDVLSIFIGINDTWRRYDSNDPTSTEAFMAKYRRLLEWTRKDLDTQIVLVEPFVLPIPEDRRQWREDLDPKIQAVRDLAREFGTLYVPLDGPFAAAASQQPLEIWAPDGVHPSQAGHALIARQWLQAVGI